MAKTFRHLTIDERITILTEIKNNLSLKEIAVKIKKDPTTISKEVKAHRYLKECNPGPFYTYSHSCEFKEKCTIKHLCQNTTCNKFCWQCKNLNCTKQCSKYKYKECKRLKRFPYVCNGCPKLSSCKLNHYHYDPKLADKEYEEKLVSSRKGIDSDEQSFKKMDKIISDGVAKGKSIYSILTAHPEIKKSERTIYRYVSNRYLNVKDIDLRNKVKMKPRKNSKKEDKIDNIAKIRENRKYVDYINYITENPSVHGAQIDLVFGKQEEKNCILTIIFPFSNFMFGILLPNKEANTIVNAFNDLEKQIGLDNFKKIFPYILTDRGCEFNKAIEIETSTATGETRTKLFYCNALTATQKAQVERNHEFIRYYFKKGESISSLTQEKIDLMFSHINSYPRECKNNHTPYNISSIIYGEELLSSLNIFKVNFDDIILNKDLFK